MTLPSTLRQHDLRRAIRAATEAGLPIRAVEVAPDGTIRLLTDAAPPAPFDALEARFATLPAAALDDPRVRRHFIDWRDTMADRHEARKAAKLARGPTSE